MKKQLFTLLLLLSCMVMSAFGETTQSTTVQARKTTPATAKVAPDFTLTSINGKPLKLSSLRGKYVVLDFWGTWCVWCIKGMPKMKEYYAKYKKKLEIVGIDCNDTQEDWKDCVRTMKLPWKHVYHSDSDRVTSSYGVRGFPCKVIIDPKGNIVNTFMGEVPEFYTTLDTLLR